MKQEDSRLAANLADFRTSFGGGIAKWKMLAPHADVRDAHAAAARALESAAAAAAEKSPSPPSPPPLWLFGGD